MASSQKNIDTLSQPKLFSYGSILHRKSFLTDRKSFLTELLSLRGRGIIPCSAQDTPLHYWSSNLHSRSEKACICVCVCVCVCVITLNSHTEVCSEKACISLSLCVCVCVCVYYP